MAEFDDSFNNIETAADGRTLIHCGGIQSAGSTTLMNPDVLTQLGCEVVEITSRHLMVTLPSSATRHEIDVLHYSLFHLGGDMLLTVGKQGGSRLRSLRVWTRQELREMFARYHIDSDDVEIEVRELINL